ncbi:MAG: hypothetical protein OXE92_00490 [Bacteroidetes bacterium]|nr:hypothetical protein [Bacteroidota bacterium]
MSHSLVDTTSIKSEKQLRRFNLSVNRTALSESEGAASITVTADLDGGATFSTIQTLTINVSGSGIASAVDFTPVPSFEITVPANANSGSASFTLTPENDNVHETSETVTISSTSSLVSGTASILILDDDPAPRGISLGFGGPLFGAQEDGGSQTFTVRATVNGRTTFGTTQSIPVSVQGTLAPGVVGFGAVPDFSIEIPAGKQSGSADFSITPVDNSIDESDETITISSSNPLVVNSPTFLVQDDDDPPRGINLRASSGAVYEDGGTQKIEVILEIFGSTTYATDQVIPITVSGTGAPGVVGFAPVAGLNITLPAGASNASSTFSIFPINNQLDERNETITISSSAPQVTGPATINLEDDDAPPGNIRFSAAPTVIGEEDGPTSVIVTATIGTESTFGESTSILMTVTGSGNSNVVDFSSVSSFSVIFARGETIGEGTVIIEPINDDLVTEDETITLSSSDPSVIGFAVITLLNDDSPPSVELSATPVSISENDGATTVTVTASLENSSESSDDLIIPISVSGSGIEEAVDFVPVADFDLTLEAGRMTGSASFILSPINDNYDEADEVITLASSQAFVINSPTIDLLDDDETPTLSLTAAPNLIGEEDGATEIVVTATINESVQFSTAQVFPITVTGSGIEEAVDFISVDDFNLTVSAGSSSGSANFILTPVNDIENEIDELLTIQSTSILITKDATVSIIDDDDPAEIQLSLKPDVAHEERGVQTIMVTGTIINGSPFPHNHTVPLSIRGSGELTAVDFEPIPDGALRFTRGVLEVSTTFEITPIDDLEFELDETITISSTDEHVNAPVNLRLINDDIKPDGVIFTASPNKIREDAGATKVTVSATVQGTTRYTTNQEIDLTITADSDPTAVRFQQVQGVSLTIPAGTSKGSVEFEILPKNNTSHQPNGIVHIGSTSPLLLETAQIILENDDAPPTGIALKVTPSSISEGDGTIPLTIEALVQGGTTFITENVLTVSTRSSGEPSAVDFTPIPDFQLKIPAQSLSATTVIELIPENDLLDEQDEIVTFSAPLVSESATLTIVDDDAEPEGINISLNPTEIAEDAGETKISVMAHVNGSTRYATDKLLNLTVTGSGIPHVVRYTLTAPTTIMLPAGHELVSTTITVSPEDNLLDEGDEILTITASDDQVRSSAELTLIDDDAEPSGFVLSVTPEIVVEGAGATTVDVTATIIGDSRYASSQTLNISVSEGTNGGVGFESVPDFTIEVPAGGDAATNSFILTPFQNRIRETDAIIVITALHRGVTSRATILLQDDDQSTERIADVNAVLIPEATRAIIASTVRVISERTQAFGNDLSLQKTDLANGLSRIASRLQNNHAYRNPLQSVQIPSLRNATLTTGLTERITIWGHADYRALSGNDDDYPLNYDGGMGAIHLGVDMFFDKFLVGVSVAQFGGDFDYEHHGGTNGLTLMTPIDGIYQINTRTLTPYVVWSSNSLSKIWAMGSLGLGDVVVSDPETNPEESNTSMISYATGIDLKLIKAPHDFSLTVKGAAWGGQMNLDENGARINELDVGVYRFQVSLEGAYQIRMASQGMFQPFIETGLRGDLGDGQTGTGLEMGGGVRLFLPSVGLRMAGHGHVLVLHGGDINEWGFGGMVRFAPGGNSGPALELRSMTGDQFQYGQRVWHEAKWLGQEKHRVMNTRLQSRMSYGFTTTAGTVSPYTGFDLGQGIITQVGAEYRILGRLSIQMETIYPIEPHTYGSSPAVRYSMILK